MFEEQKEMSLEDFLAVDESESLDAEYQEEISEEQKEIKLKEVGELCKKVEVQKIKVDELTAQLADATAILNKLLQVDLPNIMEEAGMSELRLTSGKRIVIERDLSFTLNDTNRAACMTWLRDHNFDDIIKNTVTASFAKGEDEKALNVYRYLLSEGYDAIHKEDVHWQTMKAFLKEQIGKNTLGTEDKEIFKVYEFKLAKIKNK